MFRNTYKCSGAVSKCYGAVRICRFFAHYDTNTLPNDHHDVYKDGNHCHLYDHHHAFISILILIPSLIILCHISSSSPGFMVAIIVISPLSWYIVMRIVILSQISSYDKQHSLNSPYHHTIIMMVGDGGWWVLLTYIEGVGGTHLHCIHYLVPCTDLGGRGVCRCFNVDFVFGL